MLASLAVALALAGGADMTLPELMAALAGVRASRATFVETRHSTLLKAPLVLRGTLAYRRPDFLEKHVREPYDERLILHAGSLTLERRGESRVLALRAAGSAAVGALVEAIRGTRAGDRAALEGHFHVAVQGPRERWAMTLEPRSPEVARYVRSIVVSGAGGRIARIEVREPGGDRSVMQIDEELE